MLDVVPGPDLDRIRSELAVRFPSLHIFAADRVIRGTLPIEHDGVELDRFLVEVELTRLEADLPIVREIGGRIPRLRDLRHINADGSACVCLPEDYFLKFPASLSCSRSCLALFGVFSWARHLSSEGSLGRKANGRTETKASSSGGKRCLRNSRAA
jgi:hypothetical protein